MILATIPEWDTPFVTSLDKRHILKRYQSAVLEINFGKAAFFLKVLLVKVEEKFEPEGRF